MHLDIVFLSIESTERQQTLIDATQLVDTQVGIADTSTVVLLFGERQGFDNLLPLDVTNTHISQMFQVLIVEERRVNRTDTETLVIAGQGGIMAIGQQTEQMTDAVVEEITVATFLTVETHHLQIAKGFQGITALIDLVANWKKGMTYNTLWKAIVKDVQAEQPTQHPVQTNLGFGFPDIAEAFR